MGFPRTYNLGNPSRSRSIMHPRMILAFVLVPSQLLLSGFAHDGSIAEEAERAEGRSPARSLGPSDHCFAGHHSSSEPSPVDSDLPSGPVGRRPRGSVFPHAGVRLRRTDGARRGIRGNLAVGSAASGRLDLPLVPCVSHSREDFSELFAGRGRRHDIENIKS
jgi:hypothetical protein